MVFEEGVIMPASWACNAHASFPHGKFAVFKQTERAVIGRASIIDRCA